MNAKPLVRKLPFALAAVALIGVAVWWVGRPKPVAVVLAEIDRGKVESTIANTRAGTVEACQRTKLSTILGGRIEVLAVKEGDRVTKGQLLMKLWNDDQQAQAKLAAAQMQTTKKRVAEACTMAANAEREAERQASLKDKGFVSGSREEAAHAEALAKRASCEAARAEVTKLTDDINALLPLVQNDLSLAVKAGKKAKVDVKTIKAGVDGAAQALADAQALTDPAAQRDALTALSTSLLDFQKTLEDSGYKAN